MKRSMLPAVVYLLMIGCASGKRPATPPPETVSSVDLNRYAGLWHEIARIPNRFQAGCSCCVTARYNPLPDGGFEVINRCRAADGSWKEARGVARVAGDGSGAKLEVSFVRLLGIRLFWGDYWIIGLGDDYEYAVVGTPDRKYGWVLAREPALDDVRLAETRRILERNGYDPAVFTMKVHKDGKEKSGE